MILCHYNDLKLLKISKWMNNYMSLPKAVIEKLYSLIIEDIIEDYLFIYYKQVSKPVTRSHGAKRNEWALFTYYKNHGATINNWTPSL